MEASRGPGGLGGWIRQTGKANWRVARVDLGLNMASAVILGGVTWHTSNVSVLIDHTMSGGPNNLLFDLLTCCVEISGINVHCSYELQGHKTNKLYLMAKNNTSVQ